MYNSDVKISDAEIRNAEIEDLYEWLEEEREQMDCRIHADNYNRICAELRRRNKRH